MGIGRKATDQRTPLSKISGYATDGKLTVKRPAACLDACPEKLANYIIKLSSQLSWWVNQSDSMDNVLCVYGQLVGHATRLTCPTDVASVRSCNCQLMCRLRRQPTSWSRVLMPRWNSTYHTHSHFTIILVVHDKLWLSLPFTSYTLYNNELSRRLVRYCPVEDATLEGAVWCRW